MVYESIVGDISVFVVCWHLEI